MSNICEIHTEPLDKKALSEAPGIVGYVMKNGDKLWDLARKYHTTEKRIREVNEIGEGEPKTGEKIFSRRIWVYCRKEFCIQDTRRIQWIN